MLVIDWVYENMDVEGFKEDYGMNGWDYLLGLSIEDIKDKFGDYIVR